jgi:DNA helicase-2/ATP-dependent DNA helicase PcrA
MAYRAIENDGEEKFIAAYAKYEVALRDKGVLDFDSIVIETANLLRTREDVRARNQYRFVQVDEAQDTDEVQASAVKYIIEKHGNCVFVGDTNQNMYSWRGAVGNLEAHVKALFPDAVILPLAINYRSTQSIVDYCKEIAPNRNASVTDLTTPNEKGIEPVFRLYAREDEEAKAVILGCQDLGNTAVLARTNRQLGVVENECANRGLRYKLLGKSGYWSQREIKDVVSIIGAVVRPIDANVMGALKARCEMTKFIRKADGHGTKGVPTLLKEMQAREVGKASLYSLLCRYRGDGADAVNNLGHQLRSLRSEVSRLSGADGAKRIIERFGVLSSYDEDDNKDENVDNDPRDNIMKLVEYAGKKKSVDEFFEWTCKVQRGLRARTDALALGTIHAAKGKEWPTVFVIGVNQDVLPHIKGDLEEECRIYFVACSRAAKRLCVSANGVPSELIRHKLPERDNGVIDIWDGFTLLQR